MIRQIKDLFNMIGEFDTESGRVITLSALLMLVIVFILKMPWWLLIKPLGSLFHSKILYEGTYKEYPDGIIRDVDFVKKGWIYFIRVLPIWPVYGHKLNNKDLERLFKNKGEVKYT